MKEDAGRQLTTPAIMLRRVEYGDYDLICTFFSLDRGKLSFIAKSAKKSVKRFAGILEPFSVLQIVFPAERGKGLPILQEASLLEAFSNIRMDIHKTAYAGYMAELIDEWMEAGAVHPSLFRLFQFVLGALDSGALPMDMVSILFQIRFMTLSGFKPNLDHCSRCNAGTEEIKQSRMLFDLKKGGLVCEKCSDAASGRIALSKGTIKELLWLSQGELSKAARIRFSPLAMKEGLAFLEAFVPFHLGKEPRSLKFLQQIRR